MFQVVVSDNGHPTALSSTTKVVVTVDDVNDNAPQFDKSLYSFKILATKQKESGSQQVSQLFHHFVTFDLGDSKFSLVDAKGNIKTRTYKINIPHSHVSKLFPIRKIRYTYFFRQTFQK